MEKDSSLGGSRFSPFPWVPFDRTSPDVLSSEPEPWGCLRQWTNSHAYCVPRLAHYHQSLQQTNGPSGRHRITMSDIDNDICPHFVVGETEAPELFRR